MQKYRFSAAFVQTQDLKSLYLWKIFWLKNSDMSASHVYSFQQGYCERATPLSSLDVYLTGFTGSWSGISSDLHRRVDGWADSRPVFARSLSSDAALRVINCPIQNPFSSLYFSSWNSASHHQLCKKKTPHIFWKQHM